VTQAGQSKDEPSHRCGAQVTVSDVARLDRALQERLASAGRSAGFLQADKQGAIRAYPVHRPLKVLLRSAARMVSGVWGRRQAVLRGNAADSAMSRSGKPAPVAVMEGRNRFQLDIAKTESLPAICPFTGRALQSARSHAFSFCGWTSSVFYEFGAPDEQAGFRRHRARATPHACWPAEHLRAQRIRADVVHDRSTGISTAWKRVQGWCQRRIRRARIAS